MKNQIYYLFVTLVWSITGGGYALQAQEYDPGTGNTIYGNGTQYSPFFTDGAGRQYGAVVTDDGRVYNCDANPTACANVLKDAADKEDTTPTEPGGGNGNGDGGGTIEPPKPDDAPDEDNPGGGQQPKTESLQNAPGYKYAMKLLAEYRRIPHKKNGLYFKGRKSKRWIIIEGWKSHHAKIMRRIKR